MLFVRKHAALSFGYDWHFCDGYEFWAGFFGRTAADEGEYRFRANFFVRLMTRWPFIRPWALFLPAWAEEPSVRREWERTTAKYS